MIEPEDYGLSSDQTLAHVGDPVRGREHKAFWTQQWKLMTGHRPVLRRRGEVDISDASATHEFVGLRHVRIGCRLVEPADVVRGVVVLLHGYENLPTLEEQTDEARAFVERGLAVLAVRVRGFAGSRLDAGHLPRGGEPGSGWILHGLDGPGEGVTAAEGWVGSQAVADVVDACRAGRNWLIEQGLPEALVAVKGTSLGGTLGVVAVGQLNGRLPHEPVVDRLVMGLVTLADWPWRAGQRAPSRGTGGEIEALIRRTAEPGRHVILERLRLLDPVLHAPHVSIPVLCMLAERDEVAPAPAAAAVYNALGCDTGRKWRFVVPYGHFDGGLGNARRHALFERCAADFLDPERPARTSMVAWQSVLRHGDRPPEGTSETKAGP